MFSFRAKLAGMTPQEVIDAYEKVSRVKVVYYSIDGDDMLIQAEALPEPDIIVNNTVGIRGALKELEAAYANYQYWWYEKTLSSLGTHENTVIVTERRKAEERRDNALRSLGWHFSREIKR